MHDTNSIVVTQHKIFTSLDQANAAGYFRPWQLKRRNLKPDGSRSRASLFDAVAPADMNDLERAIWLSSADLVWIGDKIGTNRRALHHLSCTKPYCPTDRTRAIWTCQDVFVSQWKRYRCCLAGQWCEVEAKEYRYGLNEAKIKEHLRGQEPCQVYAGRYTRFVAAHVQGEAVQQALAKAEEIASSAESVG